MEVARGYGATDFVDYKTGPIEEQVLKLTDAEGVDKMCIRDRNRTIVECKGNKVGLVVFTGLLI